MDWEKLLKQIEQAALDAAKAGAKEFASAAGDDAKAFLKAAADDLKRYSEAYKAGTITKGEFEDLLQGLKALAQMNALTEAGLAEVALQGIRDAVLKAVIQVVESAVLAAL